MEFEIKTLPEKSTDLLNLSNRELLRSVEIIDSAGKQVFLSNLKTGDNLIDIPKLNKGLYLIIVWGGMQIKTSKFII